MTGSDGLTCRSVAVDRDRGAPEGPSLSAFQSPRRELWGSGVALRIDLPAPWPEHVGRVSDALASIRTEDLVTVPGSGPVAFGALPFDRSASASLVVPQVLHGHSAEGDRWMTTVAVDGTATGTATASATASAVSLANSTSHRTGPGGATTVEVSSHTSPDRWCEAVRRATERINAGHLTKVVLARRLDVLADADFDVADLLARLRRSHPGALCFAVDSFVGASPELLVSRVGEIVRAQPMAGTTARTGEPDADQRRAAELLSSQKNRTEHQITIDVVHDSLLGWCSFLDAEPSPSVVPAGPVQHLATVVEGRLSHPSPTVLELVAALHPTPAVGGWPRDGALEMIAELEETDRGRYSGPVGWIDSRGNGAFAVGIRSAQIDGPRARVFAGVGVVADSVPEAELDETRSKAQAVLAQLTRI